MGRATFIFVVFITMMGALAHCTHQDMYTLIDSFSQAMQQGEK